eukprot:1092657-Pelagomonas_calceolata.AAC.1
MLLQLRSLLSKAFSAAVKYSMLMDLQKSKCEAAKRWSLFLLCAQCPLGAQSIEKATSMFRSEFTMQVDYKEHNLTHHNTTPQCLILMHHNKMP